MKIALRIETVAGGVGLSRIGACRSCSINFNLGVGSLDPVAPLSSNRGGPAAQVQSIGLWWAAFL
jgi:hypothetical protein